MSLVLGDEHRARIAEEGRASYPHECCGFLVGRFDGLRAVVEEIQPVPNARADSPHNRYLIPPEVFARVQRDAMRRGLDIVGFYHSHPDVEARPSTFDRDHAWPGYHYVIVAVHGGSPREMRAWRLRDTREAFDETPIDEVPLRVAPRPMAEGR